MVTLGWIIDPGKSDWVPMQDFIHLHIKSQTLQLRFITRHVWALLLEAAIQVLDLDLCSVQK